MKSTQDLTFSKLDPAFLGIQEISKTKIGSLLQGILIVDNNNSQESDFELGLIRMRRLRGRWGAAAKKHTWSMNVPTWLESHPLWGKKKSNPSSQILLLLWQVGLIYENQQLDIPHLPEAPTAKKKSPKTEQWGPPLPPRHLAPSQAESPNRVLNLNYWESSTAELRLFIPLHSHPTRSTGSATEHAHRCLNALLSAGLSLSLTRTHPFRSSRTWLAPLKVNTKQYSEGSCL